MPHRLARREYEAWQEELLADRERGDVSEDGGGASASRSTSQLRTHVGHVPPWLHSHYDHDPCANPPDRDGYWPEDEPWTR